ncbi:hypothetical protein C479_08363 [Halovivax asiaticus JCM 14624]|uniref:Uncharacterized protein n=1 Tax=Halovivax asiaticus JCM 14624 TaxID=1227490 RepID=M0BIX4_9EURY|nr:hypothetical protein [Halovivax asiaticus]ELZ10810.1 hypothetical protein C479_08363 [Halovivax asiaticus JCM 14624]
MPPITDDQLFAIIVYAAIGLLGLRLWERFVGQSRVVEYAFDAGVVILCLSVLGVGYLRLQRYISV